MSPGHDIDGSLAPWTEVEEICAWETLLVGNGLSINVWPDFAYGSLYEKATSLAQADLKVFAALGGGTNFERVLGGLKTAIRVAKACGNDPAPFAARYRSIRGALGNAVRAAHVERGAVPDRTLSELRRALHSAKRIFTTNYDLILYWAMGFGETFDGFCDCFWSNGRNEFDATRASIWLGIRPVFFLHGALHLIVESDGATRKLKRDDRMLLEQFGQPIPGAPDARPLLVTEGSSQDKLAAIKSNEYLSFALDALREQGGPVVVFGHSLSAQDQHLINALNLSPERPVAVSIRPGKPARVRAKQAHVRSILESERLYFYDSTSHPLGAPNLRASGATDRRSVRRQVMC